MGEETSSIAFTKVDIKKSVEKAWDTQIEATNMIQDYFIHYQKIIEKKSALVFMPTGSGKSGIIALVSRNLPYIGMVLILTPRTLLRDQLCRKITFDYYNTIKFPIKNLPKEVQNVTSSRNFVKSRSPRKQVLVMTVQMLVSIKKKRDKIFRYILKNTSLVIVDEGHYEPAYRWSKIIRKIKTPKVLLTATPYRNDYKAFDIDLNYKYVLSYKSAVRSKYLRKVKIINRPSNNRNSPEQFVNDVINFYDTMVSNGNYTPRVIIRCDNRASIRQLAVIFKKKKRDFLGIHDKFKNTKDWERRTVPDPKDESAIFWIHQFKLLEGFDDPRFQVLAIYEKIGTTKSFVQQVGRIIRNTDITKTEIAYFLEHWDGYHTELWNGFLETDNIIEIEGIEFFYLSNEKGFLHELIEHQPKIAYVDGRFRSEFNLEEIDPEKDIKLPLRVNLYEKLENFKIDSCLNSIKEHFEEKDRVVEKYDTSKENLRIIISVLCKNSYFLKNHVFFEAHIHITVLLECKNYICFYDSSGLKLINEDQLGIGNPVDVKKLKRLFISGKGKKLVKVSLENSNLGISSIRSRSIRATAIENTIPMFDDNAQICTTAEGYGFSNHRHYVGFKRGRISQYIGYRHFPEYINWLEKIEKIIETDQSVLEIFRRYAEEVPTPTNPEPTSILIDIEEIREVYYRTGTENNREYINIEDKCIDISNNTFTIIHINEENFENEEANTKLEIKVTFEKGKYHLHSKMVESFYTRESDEFPPDVITYLNNFQEFRILPKDTRYVYVKGKFYKPGFSIGKDFDKNTYSLGKCFIIDKKIGECRQEKGTAEYYKNNTNNWDPKSLFGIISRKGENTTISQEFGDPTYFICDDGALEMADFILCDEGLSKIVLIHAKASDDSVSKCYTSNLHDICGQAIKNLKYLSRYNKFIPPNLNNWNNNWSSKVSGGWGVVKKRIIISPGEQTPQEVWKRIRTVIENPHSNKEVWLFLGNTLSKKYFEKELGNNNPKPNVIHAAYLLEGTMSTIGVEAKMKIFCKE